MTSQAVRARRQSSPDKSNSSPRWRRPCPATASARKPIAEAAARRSPHRQSPERERWCRNLSQLLHIACFRIEVGAVLVDVAKRLHQRLLTAVDVDHLACRIERKTHRGFLVAGVVDANDIVVDHLRGRI